MISKTERKIREEEERNKKKSENKYQSISKLVVLNNPVKNGKENGGWSFYL